MNSNETGDNDNVAASITPQVAVRAPGINARPKRPRGRPRSKKKAAIAAYVPQRARDQGQVTSNFLTALLEKKMPIKRDVDETGSE